MADQDVHQALRVGARGRAVLPPAAGPRGRARLTDRNLKRSRFTRTIGSRPSMRSRDQDVGIIQARMSARPQYGHLNGAVVSLAVTVIGQRARGGIVDYEVV